jgi:hypothetical protein
LRSQQIYWLQPHGCLVAWARRLNLEIPKWDTDGVSIVVGLESKRLAQVDGDTAARPAARLGGNAARR